MSSDYSHDRVDDQHVVHYPLNGLKLNFLRYAPNKYGSKSLMANHVFQDYLFPTRVSPEAYTKRRWHRAPHERNSLIPARRQDQELYDECLALDQSRTLSLVWDMRFAKYSALPRSRDGLASGISLEVAVLDILQRFFLETDPCALDIVFTIQNRTSSMDEIGHQHPQTASQKFLTSPHMSHQTQRLYAGPNPPISDSSFYQILDLQDDAPTQNSLHLVSVLSSPGFDGRQSPRPAMPRIRRRERSLPPLRSYWAAGVLERARKADRSSDMWLLSWPGLSLEDLDHRTRRRSLSRRHIARMFGDEVRPRLKSRVNGNAKTKPGVRCDNCSMGDHKAEDCILVCGHCGTLGHHALSCNVPKDRRCKCTPFPQFHRARDCDIKCSRPCGNPHPPRHRKHHNAMRCKYRCCMCGLRGHAGIDCNLKSCRCKGKHLGQDCSWNPVCRVEGCDRFLCGVHCRECGSRERPFVGWRCEECLNNGQPVGAKADESNRRV